MANPITIRKLEKRIKERVGMIFVDEVNDPRWGFVTVSRVELARDLGHCTVHYSVLGSDADRRNVERALETARGFVQRKIAAILRTRTTPSLDFRFDPSVAGAVRVSKILSGLEETPETESSANASSESSSKGPESEHAEHAADDDAPSIGDATVADEKTTPDEGAAPKSRGRRGENRSGS